jgi:hypothetical protein
MFPSSEILYDVTKFLGKKNLLLWPKFFPTELKRITVLYDWFYKHFTRKDLAKKACCRKFFSLS